MQSPSRPDDAYGVGVQSKQNEITLFAQMHCSDRMFEDVVVVGLREGESICTALAWQAKQTKDDTRFTIILCSLYVHGCKLMTFFFIFGESDERTGGMDVLVPTINIYGLPGMCGGRGEESRFMMCCCFVISISLCPLPDAACPTSRALCFGRRRKAGPTSPGDYWCPWRQDWRCRGAAKASVASQTRSSKVSCRLACC